jgi:hypothetical protein
MKNCVTANGRGFWSSSAPVGIGSAYALALATGFARHGLRERGCEAGVAH